jgi:hypothetical protein
MLVTSLNLKIGQRFKRILVLTAFVPKHSNKKGTARGVLRTVQVFPGRSALTDRGGAVRQR